MNVAGYSIMKQAAVQQQIERQIVMLMELRETIIQSPELAEDNEVFGGFLDWMEREVDSTRKLRGVFDSYLYRKSEGFT